MMLLPLLIWPSGAGNPASNPPQRSTGAQRRAAREHLSLSFPGTAPIERGRATERGGTFIFGQREASPEFPRRLSNGPTHYWRAEVRTKRDSSAARGFVKGGNGWKSFAMICAARNEAQAVSAAHAERSGRSAVKTAQMIAAAPQTRESVPRAWRPPNAAQSPRRSRMRA
jgi:hypothetical protein